MISKAVHVEPSGTEECDGAATASNDILWNELQNDYCLVHTRPFRKKFVVNRDVKGEDNT